MKNRPNPQPNSAIWDRILAVASSPLFFKLTLAWFVIQALFLSLSTKYGIPPDETYHFSLITLFEKSGWLPFIHDQTGYYSLGEVYHVPFFLYHYLLSLPFHFFSHSSHSVEILRLVNILLATWSLTLIVKLAGKLKVSRFVTNLSIFMLVNTLMFVFLAASVNYDNLLIPLALLSFIWTIDFLDDPQTGSLLKLLPVMLAGTLTAINFLPIAFGIAVVIAYKFIHQAKLRTAFKVRWSRLRQADKLLLIPIILLALLFLQRYGLNVARYHALNPSCTQVNTYQQCSQDGIFNRPKTFPQLPNHPRPTPFEYFTDWSWSMRADTFGILAHKSIDDNKIIRFWSEILLIGGTLAAARYYRPSRNWNLLIGIGIFSAAILFLNNYSGYYHTGYNFGVQGRYLFIFLPFVYMLFNQSLLEFLRRDWLKSSYVILTIAIFIISALPTYALKTDDSWYKNARAARINNDIKRIELKIISR